jgi:hypothetical protein
VNRLLHILETFHIREEPLGVAFVGPTFADLSFGWPSASILSSMQSVDGFTQLHLESRGISAFASSFGRGKLLIAQFPFEEDDPPPLRPWFAFVRLAMQVQRFLDEPESEDLSGASVLRPPPQGPNSTLRVSHAPLPRQPK